MKGIIDKLIFHIYILQILYTATTKIILQINVLRIVYILHFCILCILST